MCIPLVMISNWSTIIYSHTLHAATHVQNRCKTNTFVCREEAVAVNSTVLKKKTQTGLTWVHTVVQVQILIFHCFRPLSRRHGSEAGSTRDWNYVFTGNDECKYFDFYCFNWAKLQSCHGKSIFFFLLLLVHIEKGFLGATFAFLRQ